MKFVLTPKEAKAVMTVLGSLNVCEAIKIPDLVSAIETLSGAPCHIHQPASCGSGSVGDNINVSEEVWCMICNKIEMVKAIRTLTGWGFKHALDFVNDNIGDNVAFRFSPEKIQFFGDFHRAYNVVNEFNIYFWRE